MPKILILDPIEKIGLDILGREAEVTEKFGLSEAEICQIVPEYDAILVRSKTKVTRAVIEAGKNLKVIARAGIGVDNIDVQAATERGIPAVNTPGASTTAVSEHTIGLMLAVARKISQADQLLHRGMWEKEKFTGIELQRKTLGIIGYGRIGKEVGRLAQCFGMQVMAYDPFLIPENGAVLHDLEDVLRNADILTIHAPLLPTTKHLLNRERLSFLKQTAMVINTARGGIVDETALYDFLKEGKIAGAGLDVFEEEPLKESPLKDLPNVVLTPHIGGSTHEAKERIAKEIAESVLAVLGGERPPTIVNPEVFGGLAICPGTSQVHDISWEAYDIIVFDCDSTLVTIEGINELARLRNQYEEVEKITNQAMAGEILFEEALSRRLAMIQPTRADFETVGRKYLENLVPDAKEVIGALHFLGRQTAIVTGGYEIPTLAVANYLGIPRHCVFSNAVRFDASGRYAGLGDLACSDTQSKFRIIQSLRRPGDKVAMIGDGSTDLLCAPRLDLFVGYGGVVEREPVASGSRIYLRAPSLSPFLVLVTGRAGWEKLISSPYRRLAEKGASMLFDRAVVETNGRGAELLEIIRSSILQSSFRQNQLRIPGPTPLPPEIREITSRQMINHRGSEFKEILPRLTGKLKQIFETAGDVLVFPASGTGGMEAAIVNLFSPNDAVLAVSIGYFGDRFSAIAENFGLDVIKLKFSPGQAADPEQIAQKLKEYPQTRGVLVTHNETSTGVTNDLDAIAKVVKGEGKLLIVDAISSLAALPLKMDERGIDVCIAASQKATMSPPGAAMVAISPGAWKAYENAILPRFYWDFSQAKEKLEKGETPSTPTVSIILALDRATDMILTEGLENVFQRHGELAMFFRAGLKGLGFSLLADESCASNTVTAAMLSEGLRGKTDEFRKLLKQHCKIETAGGQGELKGKIFRVAHMGYVTKAELENALFGIQIAFALVK